VYIVEVMSEITEEYDRGAKVPLYRRWVSVDLILLIDSRRRAVERQQRNADGTWTLSGHTSGDRCAPPPAPARRAL